MGRIPSVVHYGPFSIEEAAVQRPPGFGGWIPDGWTFLSNGFAVAGVFADHPRPPDGEVLCDGRERDKDSLQVWGTFSNNCPIRQSRAGPGWETGYRERADPQPQSASGLMNESVLWTDGPPTNESSCRRAGPASRRGRRQFRPARSCDDLQASRR